MEWNTVTQSNTKAGLRYPSLFLIPRPLDLTLNPVGSRMMDYTELEEFSSTCRPLRKTSNLGCPLEREMLDERENRYGGL